VVRLDKAIKEYTKSWDKLLEVKDKEITKAKDDLAALQVSLSLSLSFCLAISIFFQLSQHTHSLSICLARARALSLSRISLYL